jgi:hypothetical protein
MSDRDHLPAGDAEAVDDVLLCYGHVMWLVQQWEQMLAGLWWYATRKSQTPTGDFDTRRSQQELRRLEAAFLRSSATATRKAVAPLLDGESAEQLQSLIGERNRLAHGFLRDNATDGGFRPGTRSNLIELHDRFDASCRSLLTAVSSLPKYRGPVSSHWDDVARRVTDNLFSGKALPPDLTNRRPR